MKEILNKIEEAFDNEDYNTCINLSKELINNNVYLFEAYGYLGMSLAWNNKLDNVNLNECANYLIESLRNADESYLQEAADRYLNELVNAGKQIIKGTGDFYVKNPEPTIADGYIKNIKEVVDALMLYLDTLNQDKLKQEIKHEFNLVIFDSLNRAFQNKIGKDFDPNNYPSRDAYNLFFDRLASLFNLLDISCALAEDGDFELLKSIYESMIIVCEEMILAKAWAQADDSNYQVVRRVSTSNYKIIAEKYNLLLNELKKLYDKLNINNNKYFEVHNNILKLLDDSLKLRIKVEETKDLIKKVNDEDLINDAYIQINEIESVLNEYNKAINKLRYSLYE